MTDYQEMSYLRRILQSIGCGSIMLCALLAMYSMTESWVATALVMRSLWIRQGSPSLCRIYYFVNDLIRVIMEGNDYDDFFQWLHVFVLMDDTDILSSRQGMLHKLSLIKACCSKYGMIVNQATTKFMVISGNDTHKQPLKLHGMVVEHCNMYIYVGSPFTSDGSTSSTVKIQGNLKMPHVLKFVSFTNANKNIPYMMKSRVFEAALMSTLLYGCES